MIPHPMRDDVLALERQVVTLLEGHRHGKAGLSVKQADVMTDLLLALQRARHFLTAETSAHAVHGGAR